MVYLMQEWWEVKMKRYIGPVSLLSIGILFGISGVIAKYLSLYFTAYQVVVLRFFFAFIFAILVLFATKQKIKIHDLDKKTLLLFAVSFPVSVIFFVLSIFHTSVSMAVFYFYIANLASSFVFGSLFF